MCTDAKLYFCILSFCFKYLVKDTMKWYLCGYSCKGTEYTKKFEINLKRQLKHFDGTQAFVSVCQINYLA